MADRDDERHTPPGDADPAGAESTGGADADVAAGETSGTGSSGTGSGGTESGTAGSGGTEASGAGTGATESSATVEADSVIAEDGQSEPAASSRTNTSRTNTSRTKTPRTANARTATARGVVVAGARVLGGVIGLAAVAATVVAATLLPLPEYRTPPPAASVTPVPAAQQRVCAGPLLRLGDETGAGASVASAVGSPQLRHYATGGTAQTGHIASTDEPAGRSATVLRLAPAESAPNRKLLLSGSQLQALDTAALAGLAAAECVEARSDTWLVGGSTDTGRTTLLTLANPGTVAATVNLTIYSADGEVDAPGADAIVVQPDSERVFSLAGFAPGLSSPVVRVRSTGGTVVANLQQSTVRILTPGGVDIVGPAAAPATEVTIPGLVVDGHERIEATVGSPGFEDIAPVLRLFVPGTEPAHTTITVSPEGEADDITVNFELMAGRVTEFPFEHFEDGNYTVSIRSDVPLVAGVRSSAVGASGASDFVWLESAEVMHEVAVATVLAGPNPAVHLVNPTGTDAEVTITAHGGSQAPATVSVPAGSAVTVPVEPSASYLLDGFDSLRVAVSYTGDGMTSGFTLSPTGPASEPITVYP